MLSDEQFDEYVEKMKRGERYAAAEVHCELSDTAPDPSDRNSVNEWAKLYVLSAYAMNGPFLLVGDSEHVLDDLEILYDLLVDKGWLESLEEARLYADELKSEGEIVCWKEDGSGRGGGRVYADIAARVPLHAKPASYSPIRYMAGITDRVKTAAQENPVELAAGVGLLLGVIWVGARLLSKKES